MYIERKSDTLTVNAAELGDPQGAVIRGVMVLYVATLSAGLRNLTW